VQVAIKALVLAVLIFIAVGAVGIWLRRLRGL